MQRTITLIRGLRAQQGDRAPFILYIAELDEGREREVGLVAGADDCIGRRSPENELRARVGAARRIAELEAVLRIALIENRKLSTTDDLTRVASRRFFTKHFPREVERAARYGRALSLVLCDIGLCGLDRVPAGERKIPEHMVKVADEALYQSKHAGRNRVTATKLTDDAG